MQATTTTSSLATRNSGTKMRIMQETTQWSDGSGDACNHVYVFNDSMTQAIAYVPRGSKKVFKFKKPLAIDTRGRTFEELEDGVPTKTEPETIKVQGSKGKTYYLTEEDGQWSCTCPGFKFRGACRHVAEKQQSNG